jgi:hypothetical protein
MSSRRELMKSISDMDTQVRIEKARLEQHRYYFQQFKYRHQYLLVAALLLPTFLIGWREGKNIKKGRGLKRFGHFMFGTALSAIRNGNLLKLK